MPDTNFLSPPPSTTLTAAITAGSYALLLQWGLLNRNFPGINTRLARTILIRGALQTSNISYPNPTEGYGKSFCFSSFIPEKEISLYQTKKKLVISNFETTSFFFVIYALTNSYFTSHSLSFYHFLSLQDNRLIPPNPTINISMQSNTSCPLGIPGKTSAIDPNTNPRIIK